MSDASFKQIDIQPVDHPDPFDIILDPENAPPGATDSILNTLINITDYVIWTHYEGNDGTVVDKFEVVDFSASLTSLLFSPEPFEHEIDIDDFLDDGYTKEEIKMINETKKILDHKIELTATCVRIPVMVSHSESLNIEFNKTVSLSEVRKVLAKAPGCKIIDDPLNNMYATPIDSAGKNETFISRIRQDNSNKNSINLWIVSDNLLRGAALNAVEIAETYYNKLQ